MPIRIYLADRSFDPETIQSMSSALVSVCEALGLNPVDDAATRLVAKHIIELAAGGVHSSAALHSLTLERFQSPDHGSSPV
jgi:hypothetical protein